MKHYFSIILTTISLLSFIGCEREFVYRGGEEGLNFSLDTVMFDTIFTSIGSTTQNFKVYNPYYDDLIISNITLAGGEDSKFRINVNGYSGDEITDIPIRARDSLFVFVEVTVDSDPFGSDKPFIVADSIVFETSQRMQSVKLVAYGQDIHILRQEWMETKHLTKDKPYLIYDYIVVDSAETVTIDAGARLHFYKDASLLVLGTLIVEGTKDEPVLFASHRLEDWYRDKPGQWGYIHLLPGSGSSTINHAIIRNGSMGILVDSVGLNNEPIEIKNTIIEHSSNFGLLAQTSAIKVSNSIIGNCGNNAVALTVGGEYEFSHCTIASNYLFGRNAPLVFLNNYYIDKNENAHIVPLKQADFNNCIIYGSYANELSTDIQYEDKDAPDEADAKYQFNHCLIRLTDSYDTSDEKYFINIIKNEAPGFIDEDKYNYQLDTLSAAKDMGKVNIAQQYPFDILGVNRLEDEKGPDLGAYERQEKKQ